VVQIGREMPMRQEESIGGFGLGDVHVHRGLQGENMFV